MYFKVIKYIYNFEMAYSDKYKFETLLLFSNNQQPIIIMSSEDPIVTSLIAYNKACRQYLPIHCDLLTKGFIKDSMHHQTFSRVMGIGEIKLIQLWHNAASYLPTKVYSPNELHLANDVFSSIKAVILSDEILHKNKTKFIETLSQLPPIIGLSSIWEKEKRIHAFYDAIPPIIGMMIHIESLYRI